MTRTVCPEWNSMGFLPPVDAANPTSTNRSPYLMSIQDFVLHFGTTPERCIILQGMLRYRAAWHRSGLSKGFQWVDGSFLEDVETLKGRAPNDIDIVTFFFLPAGETQQTLHDRSLEIFNQKQAKLEHKVDAYFVGLQGDPEELTAESTYWYSLWSHNRQGTWKGFVQIDLDPSDDTDAEELLAAQEKQLSEQENDDES